MKFHYQLHESQCSGIVSRKVAAQNCSGLVGAFTINNCGGCLGQNF